MNCHYPDTPDIEVLICTHNRCELLQRAISSLNHCKRRPEDEIGILVVANACSDGTIAFLEAYGPNGAEESDLSAKIPLRWIEDPVPGKSHALNLAIPQACGRLIAFVDDDHRVDSSYLAALGAASERYPDADLFCGRILPDWDGNEPAWVHETGPYRIYPLPVPRFELGDSPKRVEPGTATPGGGNLAIRRGLFERNGPFRLELGPEGHNLGGAEDIEWVQRAQSRGATLYYLPDMLQHHYVEAGRLTLPYVMRKAFERSSSTIRLGKQHIGRRGVPPFMIRKVLTYLIKAATALDTPRRRFFLTRLSAAAGEIKGVFLQRRDAKATALPEVPDR